MSATTITIGAIAATISVFCWAIFFSGVWTMIRTIAQGQRDTTRLTPVIPRFKQMMIEFVAHTRMVKFRTVGWAHWLVMMGFLVGFLLWFEAYGQTFNPKFHWPLFGDTFVWHLLDELLGIGTVVGISVLIVIRQLNHPRTPERLSRFSGSGFTAAYFVEGVVLLEGLGMVFVKAGKIATYGDAHAGSDFFTMQVAKLLPASPLMVSIFAAVKLLSGMVWLAVVGRKITWGVAWHRFSAFFNIYLKREDDGGVALGAAKPMMSRGKVLVMEDADPDVDAFGAGKIEDFSWKGWLDFTTCTECGRCQSQCPAWNTGKPLSPKLLIMSLRDHGYAKAPYLMAGGRTDAAGDEVGLVDADGKPDEAKLAKIPAEARAEAARPLVGPSDGVPGGGVIDPETLWSCTNCGACVEQCPVDIEHVDHIIDMRRYQVLIESDFPSELAGLFKNLENKGNPWGQNSKDRTNWIDEIDIDIPVFGQDVDTFEGFEYLFWVGCAGAYEDRAKKTTKAVAELLDIAAVNFLVLGEGETCTGDSARRSGNEFLFQMLAQQNIDTIGEVFATAPAQRKKIVVTCAHCFNALGKEYSQLGAQYEVVHHTQLLNRLVRDKRLIPVAAVSETVTYHDPCFLGRHNKVYTEPRELMAASGSALSEMPRHGERSMCCGAGGARMWMEESLGKRINLDRVDEALSTLDSSGDKPQKIATGCPFCKVMLSDGTTAKTSGTALENKVEVVDVAQLLLESVTRGAAEVKRGGRFLGPAPSATPAAATATATKTVEAPAAAAPAAAAPAAAPKPKVGLGMGAGMKRPGQAAAATPATETPTSETPAAPAPAKSAGFGMGSGMKRPGQAAAAAPATQTSTAGTPKAETSKAETPKAETPTSAAPAAPAPAKSAGFGMGAGIKRPGQAAAAPATPAKAAPAQPEPAKPEPQAPKAEAPAAPASATPAPAKAKGFGMGAGIKRPGQAAAPAPAAAQSNGTAQSNGHAESNGTAATNGHAESNGTAATNGGADTNGAAAPTESAPSESGNPDDRAVTEAIPAKSSGFGIAAGKKRPGQR
ncbi:heterodisulfide reductase-related iron-sulfur binding cluster [Williamsia sp. CHRR-6]|uniref:heterodisulfide reductase-related iron-sulfur binding cluster n=1 Tax=Williamsia sp. CHRR-6 TaxID=2835871 RepID=UPI001BD99169|nr:heterodisulfide reductase-related iron-sulfur binding cluster [Williamsia sp. CHRR-6]MBT0566254.1 Fe-S oxidoreductase [Williamsia sp. CHRR-6]